jgi:poly-gamma-glutamate synthesis protein (capsule biosynthesis protein)
MIFLGDVAHPFSTPPAWSSLVLPWTTQPVVVNFEGPLNDDLNALRSRVLFNHSSILPVLTGIGTRVAALANNHVMDLPDRLSPTIASLRALGIQTIGAGRDRDTAALPAIVDDGCHRYVLLNFGWKTIGCRPATGSQPGVAPLTADAVDVVRGWRSREPAAALIAILHWNYEMELYPHPAHRQLAQALVEAGADAVIGHHPHRVGGIEWYRDRLIAYSVGNWWLPHGVFFDGRLSFAPQSRRQLALEWTVGQEPSAHWFDYEPDSHALVAIASEAVRTSPRLAELSGFDRTPMAEYAAWFASRRVKRKGLPIYRDYRGHVANELRDAYIRGRHQVIVSLEAVGLRHRP